MSDRPKCRATTKAGNPCSRSAADGLQTCIAHASKEEKKARGFGGKQAGGGRPLKPRLTDIIRERIEENADRVLGPIFDALEADAAFVVGNGANATLEMAPDHRTRLRAAAELLDRAYGRPKQATEVTGADGAPLIPDKELAPTDADTHTAASLVVLEAEAATAAAASTNGKASGTH